MKDLDFSLDGKPEDWKDIGDGAKRKILVYNEKMMMVCHRYVAGGKGPLHSHPHTQTTIILSGKFELVRDGKTMTFNPGDSILMESGIEHGALCLEDGDMIEIYEPMREDFMID